MIIKCILIRLRKLYPNKTYQKKILGIGFSLPGTVNEETMMLEKAPNLGIDNYNFKTFSRIYSYPIYIENEANAAALAELTLGITKCAVWFICQSTQRYRVRCRFTGHLV